MIWFDLSYLASFAVIYLSLTCFVLVWFGLVRLLFFGSVYFGLLTSSVRCATSRTVPGAIPAGVTIDFFRGSFRQNHVL